MSLTLKATPQPTPTERPRFASLLENDYYAAGCRSWDHRPGAGTISCCLGRSIDGRPLVTVQDSIGCTGDYRPEELRAIAAKLLAIAEDAEARPMGKRSFSRSYRRY